MKKLLFLSLVFCALLVLSPLRAWATAPEEEARRQIEAAPIALEDFLRAPWKTLRNAVSKAASAQWNSRLDQALRLYGFLLLCGVVSLCTEASENGRWLELISLCGVLLLMGAPLLELADRLSRAAQGWREYLSAFVPLFSALLISSGQASAAAVYSGFFLAAVTAAVNLITTFLTPCTGCFLAVTAAATLSSITELEALCRGGGALLRKGIQAAGVGFGALMAVQRIFTAAVDGAALRAGTALSSTVPIVGQALAGATGAVLAAATLLRTGLGFACIAVIGAEFLPLYLGLLIHLGLLHLAALLADGLSLTACGRLLRSFAETVRIMSALAALLFSMVLVATALMVLMAG